MNSRLQTVDFLLLFANFCLDLFITNSTRQVMEKREKFQSKN